MKSMLTVIKGAGDLASGVACRLFRAGFPIIMTDLEKPTVIRRTVSFAESIFGGEAKVEDIAAVRADEHNWQEILASGRIPVLVDQEANIISKCKPKVVIDAILAKENLGTKITDAPIVIGLGPGFEAGQDVHAVIETMRGHYLGVVYYEGKAIPNTGIPGEIGGKSGERVIRSPKAGVFRTVAKIGDVVQAGDVVAYVDDEGVLATIDGVLRGLLHDNLSVFSGMKVGDIDPRAVYEHCFSISDKARSLGGATLEAILALANKRNLL